MILCYYDMHNTERDVMANKKEASKKSAGWYRLDNAAIIYPSIQSARITTMFRFAATLTEAVDPAALQNALVRIIDRFPYYRVRLSRGLFWYYLEHNPNIPRVEKDVKYPCGRLSTIANRGFLFRVRYYHRRIAVEFCHVLTDGTGAVTFLKALVYEYLKETGKNPGEPGGIFTVDEEPDSGEFEDADNRLITFPSNS